MSASLATFPTLATARLRLLPLEVADAPALHAMTDDPRIIEAIDFLSHPFTEADAAALLAGRGDGRDRFIGIWRGARMVGVVGAHLHEPAEIEIGYWIAAACHGQGYATEAATAVIARLRRDFPDRALIAECRPDNRASWRVLEKLGFRPTGEAGSRPGRARLALSSP